MSSRRQFLGILGGLALVCTGLIGGRRGYRRVIKASAPDDAEFERFLASRDEWENKKSLVSLNERFSREGRLIQVTGPLMNKELRQLSWVLDFRDKKSYFEWRREVDQRGLFKVGALLNRNIRFTIEERPV